MVRTFRQKVSEERRLNAINQLDQIDIYRTFHSGAAEYTSFPGAHQTFSGIDQIDCMLGYEINLNKFQKIKIMQSILSDYNGMKLYISYRRKTRKYMNVWKVNKRCSNNPWIREEITRDVRKYFELNERENRT